MNVIIVFPGKTLREVLEKKILDVEGKIRHPLRINFKDNLGCMYVRTGIKCTVEQDKLIIHCAQGGLSVSLNLVLKIDELTQEEYETRDSTPLRPMPERPRLLLV